MSPDPLPAAFVSEPAVISSCGRYRYWLRRNLGPAFLGRRLMGMREFRPIGFIMLNPSTADHTQDDPTIRRCMGYADRWGASDLIVVNLFALRATDPTKLWAPDTEDPIGPGNDAAIRVAADYCRAHGGCLVAGWGNHGAYMDRADTVRGWLPELRFLKINEKTGQPAHPLYLKGDLEPQLWQPKPQETTTP